MKKVILVFILVGFTTFSFANSHKKTNETQKDDVPMEQIENLKVEEDLICSVSCSVELNGITYTVTAGNWFMSCEKASERCIAKLNSILVNAQNFPFEIEETAD